MGLTQGAKVLVQHGLQFVQFDQLKCCKLSIYDCESLQLANCKFIRFSGTAVLIPTFLSILEAGFLFIPS